jgi:lysophospholipase L1-like esterase
MKYSSLVQSPLACLGAVLLALSLGPRVEAQQIEADAAASHWVGTWSAAMQPPTYKGEPLATGFQARTLREIVHASMGGQRIRVRLSNAHGHSPLAIGQARVALQAAGAAIVPGSDRGLSFGGQSSITIAPGASVLSDPVSLSVAPRAALAVSLYLPQATGAPTLHFRSRQTNYVSPPGNHAAALDMPVAATQVCATQFARPVCSSPWYFLAGVEVQAPTEVGAIVALGDSITAGAGTEVDQNRRWTDVLARRLLDEGPPMAVLNQGLDGNALWTDGLGHNAQARFDRDVLAASAARYVIVLMGINDLQAGTPATRVIAGLQQLAQRARAQGLQVYGGTLTPFARGSDAVEAQRQAVNRWIRGGGAFDAVIDFDAALRDPAQPRRLRPSYDSGDTLHPSAAGYEAMANAINLSLFRR